MLVTAQDGGLLVWGRDGMLWTVEPKELVEHRSDEEPFAPYSAEELPARLSGELPKGFQSHSTAHYVILYNTSREYAQWCGSLFEQLYRNFTNYWSRRGLKVSEPEFPWVAIVFAYLAAYAAKAKTEVGAAAESIIGYFSLRTNRMTMYDLTGVESLSRGRAARHDGGDQPGLGPARRRADRGHHRP